MSLLDQIYIYYIKFISHSGQAGTVETIEHRLGVGLIDLSNRYEVMLPGKLLKTSLLIRVIMIIDGKYKTIDDIYKSILFN